jgi:alkanesulfonate monooxygenase SsuD/methylene tetrahydromethanopterin reductase-like flavin-dependent oxidoreductase (luciferase family)
MRLGIAFTWHSLPFEALLELVRRAEAAGYGAAYVDGDVSMLESRGDGDVLDGWTLTTALLARTERIALGSIRLPHHWNAGKLAQAVATAERMFPGRLRFLASIGGHDADRRFGLPYLDTPGRIAWLDELLDALRALWRGETVSRSGRFVQLDRARVRPTPPGGRVPIAVGARRAGLLRVVARHADRWDVNLPPVRARVAEAAAALARACAAEGRDPASIERSMWIFARPGRNAADPALRSEFRHWNPWFADLSDAELGEAIVAGDPADCRRTLTQLAAELRLSLPVVDCSGLGADAARHVLDAFGPLAEPR